MSGEGHVEPGIVTVTGAGGDGEIASATRAERYVERSGGLLPGALVKELSALSDGKAAACIALDLAVLSVTIATAILASHWAVTLLAIAIVGARQHALAVLMHDASHYRLFNGRRWNEGVGKVIAWSLSISMLTYRSFHVRHHNHLFDARDPDLPLYAPYPRTTAYLVQKVLKDLFALTVFKNIQYMVVGMASAKRPEGAPAPPAEVSAPAVVRARRNDRIGLGLFQAGVLVSVALMGWLPWYLLYWALPMFTVVQVLLRVRAIIDHGAVRIGDRRLPQARTMLPGPLVRFFIIPHHEHFHLEHHLWPAIPHYNLPRAHRALEEAGLLTSTAVPRRFLDVMRAATAGEQVPQA